MNKVKYFFGLVSGLIASLKSLSGVSLKPKIFWGYYHWYFSKKYADMRCRADNRTYYVLPFSDETLIVCNRKELIDLKKK